MSDPKIDYIIKLLQNAHKMMNERTWVNDDIFEHLPTLYSYAKECTSVIEAGVRNCVSSYPLIKGLLENPSKDKKMVSIDLYKSEGMKAFEAMAKELITFNFFEGSDLKYPISDDYDLVFIDTWHVRAQLERELKLYAPHCNKYIILHDTTVDEFVGESIRNGWNCVQQSKETGFNVREIQEGLWPAVMDFLEQNPEWKIKERFKNNNGLTILQRIIPKPELKTEASELKNEIPKLEEKKIEPQTLDETSSILKYSELKSASIKNLESIIKVMKSKACTEIAIFILGNLTNVFTEITNTLQRQLIDSGILCRILKTAEKALDTTLYIIFNSHQNSDSIPVGVKYAIFNYEQAGSTFVKFPDYIEKMKNAVAVFDYSYYNKAILEPVVGKEIFVVPFSYHPSLTLLKENTNNDETTDVLFYGLMNKNRQLYADILKHTKYNIKFVTDYNLFGDALYAELKKAKIVLNLHYYTTPSVLELSRIVPLIANYKLVLSEPSDDTIADARFLEMVEFITPETIVAKLDQYLENPELRHQKVSKAFKILSSEI